MVKQTQSDSGDAQKYPKDGNRMFWILSVQEMKPLLTEWLMLWLRSQVEAALLVRIFKIAASVLNESSAQGSSIASGRAPWLARPDHVAEESTLGP